MYRSSARVATHPSVQIDQTVGHPLIASLHLFWLLDKYLSCSLHSSRNVVTTGNLPTLVEVSASVSRIALSQCSVEFLGLCPCKNEGDPKFSLIVSAEEVVVQGKP